MAKFKATVLAMVTVEVEINNQDLNEYDVADALKWGVSNGYIDFQSQVTGSTVVNIDDAMVNVVEVEPMVREER